MKFHFKNRINLVSKIKYAINSLVDNKIELNTSLSCYISQKVGFNYTYLDTSFRKQTGLSIEEYYKKMKKAYHPVYSEEDFKIKAFQKSTVKQN